MELTPKSAKPLNSHEVAVPGSDKTPFSGLNSSIMRKTRGRRRYKGVLSLPINPGRESFNHKG